MPETRHPSAQARLLMQLRLGAGLFAASALLFGMIAADLVTGNRLALLDEHLAQWLHLHASAEVRHWMWLVTQVHSTFAIACYTGVIGLVAVKNRQWRLVLTLVLCVGGGLLLNVLMKHAFQRARPHFDDPILTLATYSFPSGHVAGTTIFYGLGVVWVFSRSSAWQWRAFALVAAATMIVLVACSRMVLGVHYLSDVGAAFAEGVAWLTLCLGALAGFWPKTRSVQSGQVR